MPEWTEGDSAIYREIADVAVPRRIEMVATLVSAIPFAREEAFRIVELGSGEGRLAHLLLSCFPRASLLALDRSESMRRQASDRTAAFGSRIQVRKFDLAALDWWDLIRGADVVVSSLCMHHLNDAKKQYLYKAIAERLNDRGGLFVADLIQPAHPALRRLAAEQWDEVAEAHANASGFPERFELFVDSRWNHYRFPDPAEQPSALFHHLVWMKHAGFVAVDCLWLYAGHAVYGGFKQSTGVAASNGVSFASARSLAAVSFAGTVS